MARTTTDVPDRPEGLGRKPRLLLLRDVMEMTSMSGPRIYALIAVGKIPANGTRRRARGVVDRG